MTARGSLATEPRGQQFRSSPLRRRKRKQFRGQPCSLRGLQRSAPAVSPIEYRASPFSRPPRRRRVTHGNLPLPQGHRVAPLVRIASHLRAVLTAHVPLKLVDWSCLGPADYIEGNGLVRSQRGTVLRDRGNQRSTRHPTSAKAAQDYGSPACAWSTLHTRAYRPPCGPPWHAPPLHERMRRKSTGEIWWSPGMIAPNAFNGNAAKVCEAARRHSGIPTIRNASAYR